MQFICPQDGLPSILLANASDETNWAGIAELRVAKATAVAVGIIHFIKTSTERLDDTRILENRLVPNEIGSSRNRNFANSSAFKIVPYANRRGGFFDGKCQAASAANILL